jgi:hypothetical protein
MSACPGIDGLIRFGHSNERMLGDTLARDAIRQAAAQSPIFPRSKEKTHSLEDA